MKSQLKALAEAEIKKPLLFVSTQSLDPAGEALPAALEFEVITDLLAASGINDCSLLFVQLEGVNDKGPLVNTVHALHVEQVAADAPSL